MTATRPSQHQMTVTLPSDCEVAVTRAFDAPRRLGWAAHTSTDHVPHWLLGPPGWTMPICEIDLQPGGAWRYVWRQTGGGGEFGFEGKYLEIVPEERIVFTEAPSPEMPPAVVTLTLAEEGGRTVLTQTMRFVDQASRDGAIATGMNDGVATSYDRLDDVLATMG